MVGSINVVYLFILLFCLLSCIEPESAKYEVETSMDGIKERQFWTLKKWKNELPIDIYRVARLGQTEYPYSSKLLKEKRKGIFCCTCCGQHIFESVTKFDSKTGWLSFYDVIEQSVSEKLDHKIGEERIEIQCDNCKAHLGHLFVDGPLPTGKRYCINGITLQFKERPKI